MTAELRPEQGLLFDLTPRAKLRVGGGDRLRFLNGQISNDLRNASDHAVHACVLTAKGKINADIFVVADGDSFLVDAAAELRESLAARLERYVIADDVEIADVTDEFALLHATGIGAAAGPAGSRAVKANRFGCCGVDFWLPRAQHETALSALSQQLLRCDDNCAELIRIERGIPRWGRELTDEIIPTEANLESSAIDYAKGCYIGQEVISRIKMSGQTNKRLCGLVSDAGDRMAAGMRLFTADGDKEVGWLTSVAMSERLERQIALGFVKRGFNAAGTQLRASSVDGATVAHSVGVTIVPLPFG